MEKNHKAAQTAAWRHHRHHLACISSAALKIWKNLPKPFVPLDLMCSFLKIFFSTSYGFAGSVTERAEDFDQMISDDRVKMLLFGGWGRSAMRSCLLSIMTMSPAIQRYSAATVTAPLCSTPYSIRLG